MSRPYSQQITRSNPGCILFLADHSNSMLDGLAASSKPKIEQVASAINRFFAEIIAMCEKGEDLPRSYFDVGMIGYTTDANGVAIVGPLFQGALTGRELVSVPDLYESPLAVEDKKQFMDDGNGGLLERTVKTPIWYRPPERSTMYGTPMCTALGYAKQVIENWIATHPTSFPPLVINLTDGEATDGDDEMLLQAAEEVRALATSDGNTLLFNIHLSARDAVPILLPASESQLPDDFAKTLFRMSSELPDKMRGMAEVKQLSAPLGCRLMGFNADSVGLLKLLSLGTVVADAASQPTDGSTLPPHLR
jgi:hypothetical protein